MKTVRELIALLENEDQDSLVVMAKDAEGNGFSPFSDITMETYSADTTYSGEIGSGGDPAAVLWPIN